MRQKPGSAKGVMFITIEDESGVCNVVVWPSLYEKQRRIIFTAGMIAVRGKIQREGEVVHLVAYELYDLSADLAVVGGMDTAFSLPAIRGYEPLKKDNSYSAELLAPAPSPMESYGADMQSDTIKIKTRDFR